MIPCHSHFNVPEPCTTYPRSQSSFFHKVLLNRHHLLCLTVRGHFCPNNSVSVANSGFYASHHNLQLYLSRFQFFYYVLFFVCFVDLRSQRLFYSQHWFFFITCQRMGDHVPLTKRGHPNYSCLAWLSFVITTTHNYLWSFSSFSSFTARFNHHVRHI